LFHLRFFSGLGHYVLLIADLFFCGLGGIMREHGLLVVAGILAVCKICQAKTGGKEDEIFSGLHRVDLYL
jgi:hypothetical protein